jgi:murein DD-endopeptidase MepM/ murein hydrolase activator NlpD
LDFKADTGDKVLACLDGIVRAVVNRTTGYGLHVVIDSPEGWTTWYCHLSKALVVAGDVVEKGGVIGEAGSTGNSTGPHLHLTVQNTTFGKPGYWKPNIVDPLEYL